LRAVTLSDPDVVQLLSTQVIPVWESVGSVPKVTIEIGNGHKLERTLGGNIVTYILSPDGDVYDAYPGVYTPSDYINEIQKTLNFLKQMNKPTEVISWHRDQFSDLVFYEQQQTSFSKAFVESPLLNALKIGPATRMPRTIEEARSEALATKDKFRDISKDPATVQELSAALLNYQSEDPKEIGQKAVEADSYNNVKLMRPAVHALYSNLKSLPKVLEFRDIIYKELLHIPLNDPYLGLADAIVPGSPVAQ
jgi:hypothetical protein